MVQAQKKSQYLYRIVMCKTDVMNYNMFSEATL